jgi:hypothetical protein
VQVTNPISNAETLPRRELARILFQERYLEAFRRSLPYYPYATDDPTRGVKIMKRENALKRRYIQIGHYPHVVMRIVLDVDAPWPQVEEETSALPPTLMLVNPETGHFHVWYELDPIPLNAPPGRAATLARTIALLARVEAMLEVFYSADPSYNGLLSRNPLLHPPEWRWGGGRVWSLSELYAELRDRVPRGARVQPELVSYGRNVTLFDRLRVEAYANVGAFRGLPGGEAAFHTWVHQRAHALNQQLFHDHPRGPLDPREVAHTARSVARWTWAHYRGTRIWPVSGTGRPDRSQLPRAARAAIKPLKGEALEKHLETTRPQRVANLEAANRKRRGEAEEALVEALKRLQTRGEAITARALAREAGVSPTTASRWLQRMRGQG